MCGHEETMFHAMVMCERAKSFGEATEDNFGFLV
jgi:hypothetical protein